MRIALCLVFCFLASGCVHLIVPAVMSEAYNLSRMKKIEDRLTHMENKIDKK